VKKRSALVHPAIFILFFGVLAGCAHNSGTAALVQNPDTAPDHRSESPVPLVVTRLTEESVQLLARGSEGAEVFIIVHPGYSVFVDGMHKKEYPLRKRALARAQHENEARFVEQRAKEGKIVVLIVPSDGEGSRAAPSPYHVYLNRLAGNSLSVFYTVSQTAKNGALTMEDMIVLYRFLDAIRARAVYVGGGYIGRCQQEFAGQLTRYFDASRTYIVPEASTVSPEDVTEREADTMLAGIARGDFLPVREFISRRTEKTANILSPRM
jgi:hypothetical protein